MATKKFTKKSASVKKSAPAKTSTTVRTIKASEASVSSASKRATSPRLQGNIVNIILAELVGTFVLCMVALMTASSELPLFIGLTLAILVMTIGAVSGSHVNPAVTFGLWASRKLKGALVPFYWVSQLLGAIAALVVTSAVSGTKLNIDFFGHFTQFSWPIFFVELVGTAVFLWGLTSVLSRNDVSANGKALGVGLSLFVGILVATSLYSAERTQAIANYQKAAEEAQAKDANATVAIPHSLYVAGATLNPAVALATTETPESQLKSSTAAEDEKRFSRFGWEVILATLAGAALGANLTRLINYRFRD